MPIASAPVVSRPVRRATCGYGVVEYLILVGGPGDAVHAGRAAVGFPGTQDELVSTAAVTGSPGVAAALFGIADADPERRVGGVHAGAGWRWCRARARARAGGRARLRCCLLSLLLGGLLLREPCGGERDEVLVLGGGAAGPDQAGLQGGDVAVNGDGHPVND